MVVLCWACGIPFGSMRWMRMHLRNEHTVEEAVNNAPDDWKYVFMTADGQRSHTRGKENAKVLAD